MIEDRLIDELLRRSVRSVRNQEAPVAAPRLAWSAWPSPSTRTGG